MKAMVKKMADDFKKAQQKEILTKDFAGWNFQEDLISEMVRKSREKGDLDSLPGKGKPFQWEEHPGEPEGERALNRILKNNGVVPPWIQLDKEIRESIEIMEALSLGDNDAGRSRRKEMVQEINQKIAKFNLICPVSSLQKRRLTQEK